MSAPRRDAKPVVDVLTRPHQRESKADASNVFYDLTVAPEEDVNRVRPAFQRIGNPIHLND